MGKITDTVTIPHRLNIGNRLTDSISKYILNQFFHRICLIGIDSAENGFINYFHSLMISLIIGGNEKKRKYSREKCNKMKSHKV